MNPFKTPPKKILIVNIFGIGDVLFTTPLISNLKVNFPQASISYLSNRRSATILENHPKLDKIFIYERDEYRRISKRSKLEFLKKSVAFFYEIKRERFDVVFDFSLNSTFDLFMLMAGIKTRIGLNYKNRGRFLTHKFTFDGFEGEPVAQSYLNLLKKLGLSVQPFGLEMNVTPQDMAWARNFIKEANPQAVRPVVGVIPGGGASWGKEAVFRRWDPDKFSKLVDKIVENYKAKIILMGDQAEEELCHKIRSSHPKALIEAYGRTTVGQFAALMRQCDVVVLNDGGPLHVAVACGAKTISIFGPVDEVVYGPFGTSDLHAIVKHDIACRPCYRRFRMTDCRHISCLKNITVEEVFQKVKDLL